ncbi:MAG TPA: hypothetical protein VK157_12395 [Phycisphaerales bacterium]|nr:hypothetical protein [Phycisphaerales bacterium]
MHDREPLRIPLDIVAGDDAFRRGGPPKPGQTQEGRDMTGRPFLMVWFKCAGAYQKVFRNAQATQYSARCPKCGKTMQFAVGSGGENRRMFEVSC